ADKDQRHHHTQPDRCHGREKRRLGQAERGEVPQDRAPCARHHHAEPIGPIHLGRAIFRNAAASAAIDRDGQHEGHRNHRERDGKTQMEIMESIANIGRGRAHRNDRQPEQQRHTQFQYPLGQQNRAHQDRQPGQTRKMADAHFIGNVIPGVRAEHAGRDKRDPIDRIDPWQTIHVQLPDDYAAGRRQRHTSAGSSSKRQRDQRKAGDQRRQQDRRHTLAHGPQHRFKRPFRPFLGHQMVGMGNQQDGIA
ncbi:hypothetical protein E4T56_gene17529, partial [Termitomyces sp. T112]